MLTKPRPPPANAEERHEPADSNLRGLSVRSKGLRALRSWLHCCRCLGVYVSSYFVTRGVTEPKAGSCTSGTTRQRSFRSFPISSCDPSTHLWNTWGRWWAAGVHGFAVLAARSSCRACLKSGGQVPSAILLLGVLRRPTQEEVLNLSNFSCRGLFFSCARLGAGTVTEAMRGARSVRHSKGLGRSASNLESVRVCKSVAVESFVIFRTILRRLVELRATVERRRQGGLFVPVCEHRFY